MTRQSLDLAAKAAGLVLEWRQGVCKGGAYEAPFIAGPEGRLQAWKPCEDDGDALRLASACGMDVIVDHARRATVASKWVHGLGWMDQRAEHSLLGIDAAAREAIFKLAVRIGETR